MNHSNLSLEQAPPIETPLRFFITAPVFLILASLILLFYGPETIQNRWLPQTLALTHLITLGFISMAMIGALFQLLPVLAGCNIPHSGKISLWIYLLYVPGTLSLTLGFLYTDPVFFIMAILLLISALVLFLTPVSINLFKIKLAQPSASGIKYSISSLWVAIGFAILLLSSYAWETIPLLREYTQLHIGWAITGWICILMISVAYQVIPMFQITSEYPDFLKKYFPFIIFTCLFIWSLSLIYEIKTGIALNWIVFPIITVCCLSLLFFIYTSFKLLLQRRKKIKDASLFFWFTGLANLAVGLLLYLYSVLTLEDLSTTIGLFIFAGFAMSIINGMLYKIVPFLIWMHLHQNITKSRRKASEIPTIYEIINQKKSYRLLIIHNLAFISSLLSIYFPNLFFYPASLLWLFSGCLLFKHLLQAFFLYRRFIIDDK